MHVSAIVLSIVILLAQGSTPTPVPPQLSPEITETANDIAQFAAATLKIFEQYGALVGILCGVIIFLFGGKNPFLRTVAKAAIAFGDKQEEQAKTAQSGISGASGDTGSYKKLEARLDAFEGRVETRLNSFESRFNLFETRANQLFDFSLRLMERDDRQ